MSCNGVKKEIPRLLAVDIYKQIAKASNLTVAQVTECFQTYYKLLNGVIESDYKSSDFQFCLPNIGYFYFVRKEGIKKGRVYKIPNLADENYAQQIIEKTEDEADYEIIKFKISEKLKKKVKERTRGKYEQ